jgi:assimilatory nitrate reductase catalytic subunit
MGARPRLAERGWLGCLFGSGQLSDADRASLFAGRPADGSASTGPVVRACYAVGRDALVRAIVRREVTNVKEIGRLPEAGTNRSSCIPGLKGLISEHACADASEGTATADGREALAV